MVARDGRGVEVEQAASLSSLADLPDAADPTAFESLQSLIYTAEDGRVISDRVIGWEWSKPGNATVSSCTERSVALVEHEEVATQARRRRDLLCRPTVDDAVPAALASAVHAAAAAATCAAAGCALDRCAVRLVMGAPKTRRATGSRCGSGRAACRWRARRRSGSGGCKWVGWGGAAAAAATGRG